MKDTYPQKEWIRLRKAHAKLTHYRRMNIVSKDLIFAEADFFRAASAIWKCTFDSLDKIIYTQKDKL
tara:strand:- start:71 stop:271 length:201 start_codon:yes stop_codon:yes gene_type:complete